MSQLEQAKNRLEEYKKKQEEFMSDLREEYDDGFYEDVDEFLDAISNGPIALAWQDGRTREYWYYIVLCQEMLVSALETLSKKDSKSLHNANKILEDLVHNARMVKKFRKQDIERAQNVIDIMDDIIKICEENRK